MSETRDREGVGSGSTPPPVEREAPPEGDVERETPHVEPPRKQHGDALLDGSGSRHGDAGRPEEPSQ